MALSLQSLVLGLLVLAGLVLAVIYDRRAKALAAQLTEAQRIRFEAEFRDRAARGAMPTDLAP
ncbi:hypothetical protein, partial [Roseicyclus sp.]|uniref:hypothetical protein n=1 Tax=Roseicyclus sp. TaxID=1914329 RepID=UPI003FA179D2